MAGLDRIWNSRASGLPSALMLGIGIAFRTLRHHLATALWRGNLGAVGTGTRIQANVIIRYPGRVIIGRNTSVATGVEIASEKPDGICRIGSEVIIGVGVRLDFSGGLSVGDNVVISEDSTVLTHSHGLDPKSRSRGTELTIEDDVWIGSSVIIKEGVTCIGKSAVIAAGSVVTRAVRANSIVAGVPAREIRTRGITG